MVEIEFISIDEYLNYHKINTQELFKRATHGKIALLIYLEDITGSLVGKNNDLLEEKNRLFEKCKAKIKDIEQNDSIIIVKALFKLTTFQCGNLMLNNTTKIFINQTLEFYEGEYKFQIAIYNNGNLTNLDYINIPVKPPKNKKENCRLFQPTVFTEEDKNKYAFGMYDLIKNGDEYCYCLSIERILVLQTQTQK